MAVLEHHAIQDVEFPLAFNSLGFGHKVVAKILGPDLWLSAYPDEPPSDHIFIPRRILGALRVAMNRLAIATEVKDKVVESEVTAAVAAAASAFDDWQGKRRAEASRVATEASGDNPY